MHKDVKVNFNIYPNRGILVITNSGKKNDSFTFTYGKKRDASVYSLRLARERCFNFIRDLKNVRMVTLTIRDNAKNFSHKDLNKRVGLLLKNRFKFYYVVTEFQKNGNFHYHILLQDLDDLLYDVRYVQKMRKHWAKLLNVEYHPRLLWVTKGYIKNPHYMSKYLSKSSPINGYTSKLQFGSKHFLAVNKKYNECVRITDVMPYEVLCSIYDDIMNNNLSLIEVVYKSRLSLALSLLHAFTIFKFDEEVIAKCDAIKKSYVNLLQKINKL